MHVAVFDLVAIVIDSNVNKSVSLIVLIHATSSPLAVLGTRISYLCKNVNAPRLEFYSLLLPVCGAIPDSQSSQPFNYALTFTTSE